MASFIIQVQLTVTVLMGSSLIWAEFQIVIRVLTGPLTKVSWRLRAINWLPDWVEHGELLQLKLSGFYLNVDYACMVCGHQGHSEQVHSKMRERRWRLPAAKKWVHFIFSSKPPPLQQKGELIRKVLWLCHQDKTSILLPRAGVKSAENRLQRGFSSPIFITACSLSLVCVSTWRHFALLLQQFIHLSSHPTLSECKTFVYSLFQRLKIQPNSSPMKGNYL